MNVNNHSMQTELQGAIKETIQFSGNPVGWTLLSGIARQERQDYPRPGSRKTDLIPIKDYPGISNRLCQDSRGTESE